MARRDLFNDKRWVDEETVLLIYFSKEAVRDNEKERFENLLREIHGSVLFFTNQAVLLAYIKSTKSERVPVLIYSDFNQTEISMELISSLESSHVEFIVLFTNDETVTSINRFPNVYVCHNEQFLMGMLEHKISILQRDLDTTVDYIKMEMNEKFVYEIAKESGRFLYWEMFKDIILNMTDRNVAKATMIEQCRFYYFGNEKQLEYIDRFDATYHSDDCIRWYTKDCFLYRLINKALRTEDVEQLFLFRFYLADLCRRLQVLKKTQYAEYWNTSQSTKVVVYRGTLRKLKDLEVLRSNINRIISFNGFVSASRAKTVALVFAGSQRCLEKKEMHSIVFQIHVDLSLPDVIAADISKLSEHPEEEEFLFDIGSTFRVETLSYDIYRKLWHCTLVATEDGAKLARDHIQQNINEMQRMSPDIRFASLLIDMCAFSKARAYLEDLLNDTDRSDLAQVHLHLGRTIDSKKDYKLVMGHLHKALELENDPIVKARIMHEIGIQLYQRGDCMDDDYGNAMIWEQRAFEIYTQNGCQNSIGAAYCLNNIGFSLSKRSKFIDALDFYKRALEIRQAILPQDHAHIAQSFRNIGMVYMELGDCDQGLEYQDKALAIVERTVPAKHWSHAYTYRNFGHIYHRKGDFTRSCENFEKAITIFEQAFTPEHSETIRTKTFLECAQKGSALPLL